MERVPCIPVDLGVRNEFAPDPNPDVSLYWGEERPRELHQQHQWQDPSPEAEVPRAEDEFSLALQKICGHSNSNADHEPTGEDIPDVSTKYASS